MPFPESMKAGRFVFSTEQQYAGRLISVTKRSIENQESEVVLFRLEFEIFVVDSGSNPPSFIPTGGVASRDVVVTNRASSDERLAEYAKHLNIGEPNQVRSWYLLDRDAAKGDGPWILIRFGTPDDDHRQPFRLIEGLVKPKSIQVKPYDSSAAHREKFWRIAEICQLLRNTKNKPPSQDTVTQWQQAPLLRILTLLTLRKLKPGPG